MGLSTVNWDRVVALAEAKIGADLTDKSAARLGHLINAAARYIYDESRYHPRFLVLEPRTATNGYIEPIEDSIHVGGAGTIEANGLYTLSSDQLNNHPVWELTKGSLNYYIRRETHDAKNTWHIVQADTATTVTANAYLYSDGTAGTAPDADGWTVDTDGTSPAPTARALSEIDEIITYWDGAHWVGANPAQAYGYPDQNGFRLTTNLTGIIYVAHKKVLPDAYGDGTLGTSGDFPSEWLNYCAQSAAQQWMESNRRPESFNPISVRSVEKLEGQVLVKANRQGAFDTIGNIWTTRYAQDTTITT